MKKRLEFLSWYTTNGESKEEQLIFHVSMLVGQAEEPGIAGGWCLLAAAARGQFLVARPKCFFCLK